eukprot:1411810-Rhodomonas_salina.4
MPTYLPLRLCSYLCLCKRAENKLASMAVVRDLGTRSWTPTTTKTSTTAWKCELLTSQRLATVSETSATNPSTASRACESQCVVWESWCCCVGAPHFAFFSCPLLCSGRLKSSSSPTQMRAKRSHPASVLRYPESQTLNPQP